MNSNIIPQGPIETVTDGSYTDKHILIIMAETDLTISNIVYKWEPNPAGTGKINAFTLKAGRFLPHVKTIAFTGTATVVHAGATP